ncbi:hypothetical protein [Geomonas propionica]|uniref:Uncharacterized protein n=1 Tax=Geomonas propionica TaxID=2798582 RepID=A0ABS0YMV4_9BACT|nr:hypothetical protein [Geomonas propionica]MBJ6798817.1 hypothetical protein [Geomonas propionica]
MSYQDLFDELRALQKLKNNWYSVAGIVKGVKEAAVRTAHPARRLRDASEASGYSPNTLNRMIVVRDFFDAVKDLLPELSGIDPNFLPFTTLEVVKRLHQVDPEQGIQMLLEVVAGRMTIRKLREKYEFTVADKTDVASAHQIARFEVKDFEAAALTALQASASKLFEEPFDLSQKPLRFPPISVVGYRSRTNSFTPVLGFDFFLTRIPDQSVNLDRLLQRVLSYSGFFTRYWVIFASNVGEQRIRDFCMIMRELNRLSVGVATLPWGDERTRLSDGAEDLEILLNPMGDPAPDWRQMFAAVQDFRSSMNRPRS